MLIRKNPDQIKKFLREKSYKLDMPELWVGDEPNTYGPWGKGKFFKDHDYFFNPENDKEVARFIHLTCWDLVQTAGNQTVPLLNQIVNDFGPTHLAERGAFPPTRKDVDIFNKFGIPPFSLESKHCAFTDFDVVGTTLAFPGFYVNLLKQFRDAGVPERWEDRDSTNELYPLVFCGGQIFAQPGPIEPVVDVVVVGEGEDGISGSDGDPVGFPSLLCDVIKAKQDLSWYNKEGRIDLLHKWAREHAWCYVPRFYDYKYADPRLTRKHFISHTPKLPDIPLRPKRRWIKDIDAMPSVVNPIINAHDPSMGLGEIEVSRSCTGKCSFCAEIYRYAPYREKSVENLVEVFRENIKNSGSLNAFPTGFDFPCYSRKHELYVRLLSEVCADVDTQSSRVDHFVGEDAAWAKLAGDGGMRQLAVGVEGNSERLRMIMSKGCTEEKILESVRYAIESKFEKVKFFMIADWEWEREEDTQEIIQLGKKIVEMKQAYGSTITIRFSWTPLLIEAWTPLMWDRSVVSSSILEEDIIREDGSVIPAGNDFLKGKGWVEAVNDKKLVGVYDQLKPLNIGFTLGKKTERNYYYFMQAFHMADRLLAEVMIKVARELDQVYCGAVDRGWISAMYDEMTKVGLTWDHYFRRKDWDENFWWDIIDLDIPKKWFLDYAKKMHAMIEATDPGKLQHQPMHQELVDIGKEISKTSNLKMQSSVLEKGMLVANCDVACCACMACEEGVKGEAVADSPVPVITTGHVDFYKNVMNPDYWKGNKEKDAFFKDIRPKILDESSVVKKVWMKINIDGDRRFMPNDFWIASIRRSLYLSDIPISKRTIKMASDVHGYKVWVSGNGYIEFGLREYTGMHPSMLTKLMNDNAPRGMTFGEAKYMHRDVDLIRRNQDYVALYHYELDANPEESLADLRMLANSADMEMSVKRDEYRKGISTVKMRIKDWIKDAWLINDGHNMKMAMMMNYGEPTPYNVAAAVFGISATDVHEQVCNLIDLFPISSTQIDFFAPTCIECGNPVPVNVLGKTYNPDYCPQCLDKSLGKVLGHIHMQEKGDDIAINLEV